MSDSRVLLALLSYVEPLPRAAPASNPCEWTLTQTEELQLHALAALAILLPQASSDYFDYHVGARLLLFYEWAVNDADEYQSQGHGFFGKGGRNNKRSQLRYILRLFRSLVSNRDDRIQLDLCDQGIIPSITGLSACGEQMCRSFARFEGFLRRVTQQTSMQMDHIDLDIICDGLFVLSCLCEQDVHRKVRE